jgi:hypothetical protein
MRLSFFLWIFFSALLARLWRAGGLLWEAGADDGFVWLPLGLCADLLFAAGAAAAVAALWRRPRLQLGTAALIGLAHIGWLGLNLVSFTLTQAPITYQRARGDEGVKLEAHALLRFEDVVPALAFGAAALLAFPAAVIAARAVQHRVRAPLAAGALSLAAVGYGADLLVLRGENFGVADHPVFTLVASFVDAGLERSRDRRPVLEEGTLAGPGVDRRSLLAARSDRSELPPPPSRRASARNVVVVFAEGIARKHTSLGGIVDATPHLARRARESGLELTRYHSNYHKSIAAIFSAVCASYPPPNGHNIVEINGRIDCGEFSEVLASHAIHPALFHGGDFGFYDKLMLLGMRAYEVMKDARAMSDPLVYEENNWGIDDRAPVDHLLAWIDTLPPGERFGGLLIPITAHWPYWIPSDVEPRFAPTSSKNEFLSAVGFLDGVLEKLMLGLEERGLAEETAVIFLADHGETVGERPRASAGRRLAYEPSLHVPFVILLPGMWPAGAQSDRLGSHVDLLPTVLDLLGLPPDPRHQGTSLLAPDREPQRIFIGASNGPKSIGFLDGDRKLIVNRTTGRREAYDLAADPDERRNLIDDLEPGDIAHLEQEALAFAALQQAHLREAPRRDDALDIEGVFLEAAEVRVRRRAGDQEVVETCAPVPDDEHGGRSCPGEAEPIFLGRHKVRAGGTHDCLLVRAPADGVLELEVKDEPWLPLLTRIRVVQTAVKRPLGLEAVAVEAWSDGQLHGRRATKARGHIRMPFASPRERLLLRIGGSGTSSRDLCISLTERGWRNRPLSAGDERAAPEPGSMAEGEDP